MDIDFSGIERESHRMRPTFREIVVSKMCRDCMRFVSKFFISISSDNTVYWVVHLVA